MNIIIYNINSFGGNYEYSKYLFKAYKQHKEVNNCILLMPCNAEFTDRGVIRELLSDLIDSKFKLIKKVYYLYRSLLNPFRLFFYLKKQSPSVVIFNDFDQITSWLWAPFFKFLKGKHEFAVILHDPDRDKFFPFKFLSESSMKRIMSFMDIAFYHGFLPDKPYYKENVEKISIPHGIYENTDIDKAALQNIIHDAGGHKIIGVLGNIRDEKNYKVVIDALAFADVKLLIAGQAANSGVSTDVYKAYASEKGVTDKIIWREEYLTTAGFNAAIAACDIVLLYYKPSFTSQSGVLNTIAPFRKKLIISDVESSLRRSVESYGIGKVVPHDNASLLAEEIKDLLSLSADYFSANWDKYIANSSWDKHVAIAIDSINSKE